jgi:5-methylthioadenosine/S-adenosylhomocysteine deaminase
METADRIVRADYVVTMDDNFTVVRDGAVVIRDGKIVAVDRFDAILDSFTAKHNTDGANRVIFPGLINTHCHAAMVYFRGMADDLPLKAWLEEHIWPAENRFLSDEFVYDAVQLACLEMVKAGITTYNDMYFFKEAAAKATSEIGMRAVLGVGILDFATKAGSNADQYLASAEAFFDAWQGHELITPCIAPHAIYTCSRDTLRKALNLAQSYNTAIHIHLSETKWEVEEAIKQHHMPPVLYLDNLGFLDNRVIAAHCVWLTEEEIDVIAATGVSVAHCVKSNLKLASGIAPVVQMLRKGVKVGLGTDGAASNNTLDILSEMSLAAKLHKAVTGDPTALDDRTALLMATRWGAEALRMDEFTGSLTPGKDADLVVANLNKPHLTPIYDIYSHIVYALSAQDVETVFIKGKPIVEQSRLLTEDETTILEKAHDWQKKIRTHNTNTQYL